MNSPARTFGQRARIPAAGCHRLHAGGFTLIELMIAIIVVGILAAVAYPQYTEFVQRSKITDATSQMNDFRVRMEQFFQDNRSYVTAGNCGVADPAATNFTFVCAPIPGGYRLTTSGVSAKGMGPFAYRLEVDNAGVRRITDGAPAGWSKKPDCWTVRRNGECS